MAADVKKLWKERKDGLQKTIEIVEKAFTEDKFQTDQKDKIKGILDKVIELAMHIGIPHKAPEEKKAEEEEEQAIKLTKEEVDKLIGLFNKQLDAIKAVEKLLIIEIKEEEIIGKKIDDFTKAKTKSEIIKALEEIKKMMKLEDSLMKGKEYRQLRMLVYEYEQIQQAYDNLNKLCDEILKSAETLTGSAKENFRVLGVNINNALNKIDRAISDESRGLQVLSAVLKELIGPEGHETMFLKLIETKRDVISKYNEADAENFVKSEQESIKTAVTKIKDALQNSVLAIRRVGEDITLIKNSLESEILVALNQAKELVK